METTLEDVWKLFRETSRQFEKTGRQFEETSRQFAETDRRFKETDLKFAETDRRFKETDLKFKETDRNITRLEQLFESQWGKLIESLVEGDLVPLLTARGIPISDTSVRLKGKLPDGNNYEFDILAHNGEAVVVVEVKTTLKPKHVKQFINKLEHFKQWIPRYANNRVYGAMAWLVADAGAETMVLKKELFGIRATGDSAHILNPEPFTPREW